MATAQRAEELFRASESLIPELTSPEEIKQHPHELQMLQIEPEMHNEELLLRTQSDLEAARASYFDLYDLAPVGYLTVSNWGLILKTNLAAATMLGVARNDLLKKPMTQFICREDLDSYYQHHKRAIESGGVQKFEIRLVQADGVLLWVHLQTALADNREYRITAIDITERMLAEEQLRESEEKYRAMIDAIDGDMYICSKEYRIEFLNNKLIRHLGRNATGECCYKALYDSDTVCEWCDAAQVIEGKSVSWEFKNPKDERWYEVHNSPINNGDGTISRQTIITDITEKKSVFEQLVHSQKIESIGQLAGGLAHDLNNILSVVSGYTTLAQLGMDKEQEQFRYLDEVIRATSRAASLTHSLLVYSRKQEMNQQRQNLNLLITTVSSFISRIIHDNITFTLSLAAAPLGVNVDTVQIEQVLLNLATNARDAMPDGGTFTIATNDGSMDEQFIATHGYGTIGRYAIITVTDSGHGMDEQTKHKVFNPFFTTKEIGKGTGLGLSMVMGIIKQHGGFIDLQSEPGRGSVFQLYLPLVEEAEEVTVLSADKDVQIEKVSGTILVAEDDPNTRALLAEFLTLAGYTVITATDGQDAVEKFAARTGEIDLVISDVVMPRKSGKTACDEIRQMSESVKFIFVSGHAGNVIEREGILGANTQIIIKPILPFELLRKVREIIPHTC
jgi:two-component system, cell cycle sensor histidine kinase and response regulator CckA